MANIDQMKEALTRSNLTKSSINRDDFLSTGCTLLNLACTGYPDGGLAKGKYFFLVGDTMSGKTFLSRTILAEATINKRFSDYRLIYDDVEDGALMDTERYFGKALADRLEAPQVDADGCPIYSHTIEDFYFNLDDALGPKQPPCIYILDSMDSLSSKYEGTKFEEKKKANRKGTIAKGDYGDGKAKINSSAIRQLLPRLKDTGSILLIINQTRDNIDASMFEPVKTRSGGHALSFYSTCEFWTSVGSQIKRTVNGTDRKIGAYCKVFIKKNRTTGRNRVVQIPFYYSHGIDDVGCSVDFLTKEKHWKKKESGIIKANDFDFEGYREALIGHIESNDLEFDLTQIVADVWREVEKKCEIKRKPRY